MKKVLLFIFSLSFVFTTSDVNARHRQKKERDFEDSDKPHKHRACKRKALEIAGGIATGFVHSTIEEYKKKKTNHKGPNPY